MEPAPMRTDVHQHVWTEPLIGALAARREVPCMRRSGAAWELRLAGEPPCPIAVDDLAGRAALARADRIDRVLVAPSCPLGIESLPTDEAEPLLAAYRTGVAELPPTFAAWGAVGLAEPDPRAVDHLLDEGFAGLCLPAPSLGSPAALDAVGPLLERLAARDAPLLVHPGAAGARVAGTAAWWPALTDYVSQMQSAWLAWTVHGRARHPRLRVVFVMLAGLAPLHGERLRARGGPPAASDRLTFYDTSSYGRRAIAAMAGVVGAGQLVYGSDRPVVDPPTCDDVGLVATNPARLLG
jgi:hypothetical protein